MMCDKCGVVFNLKEEQLTPKEYKHYNFLKMVYSQSTFCLECQSRLDTPIFFRGCIYEDPNKS